MYDSYRIPENATGVKALVRKVMISIENKFDNIEHFRLGFYNSDKLDKSFTVIWHYGIEIGFGGSLMINQKEGKNGLIEQFWNIDCGGSHSPEQLRTAANIHDGIKSYLIGLCGNHVSSHDGRDIYRLENICEEVSV